MNFVALKEDFKTAMNAVKRLAIIIAAIIVGFGASQLYTYIKSKNHTPVGSTMPAPKTTDVS